MRRMKKAGQYLLGIFAALLLCGIFSVNTVKAESQHIYDNASLLSDAEEQDLERSCAEFENNTEITIWRCPMSMRKQTPFGSFGYFCKNDYDDAGMLRPRRFRCGLSDYRRWFHYSLP